MNVKELTEIHTIQEITFLKEYISIAILALKTTAKNITKEK